MSQFKIGDKVRRVKDFQKKNGWFAGESVVTVYRTYGYDNVGFVEDPYQSCDWSSKYFELVTPTGFEVGKTYQHTTQYLQPFEIVFVGISHSMARREGIEWAVANKNFSKYKEVIPPPPEEWRALFYVENNKPEIGAYYFPTKEACEEAWGSGETFMYAIRTDINAKENK